MNRGKDTSLVFNFYYTCAVFVISTKFNYAGLYRICFETKLCSFDID